MGGRRSARVTGIGSAALLCLAAACLPAAAEPRSAMAGGGALVTVWEERGRGQERRAPAESSIAYSVTDASGTRVGTVPPTGDVVRDSAPFLAADGSGSLVLVWSRFDGVYRKIAFSRFEAGVWTGFRFVTFGPGDDDLPIFGAGRDGSYLFYLVRPNHFFYAPIDLLTGVLIGPPRAIDVVGLGRQKPRLQSSGNRSIQGGTDAPVNWRCRDGGACTASSRLALPGDGAVQGGTDAPVNIHTIKATGWGVASSTGCPRQVLVIPAADGQTVLVAEFLNGRFRLLDRRPLPAQAQFAESLAGLFLPAVCN